MLQEKITGRNAKMFALLFTFLADWVKNPLNIHLLHGKVKIWYCKLYIYFIVHLLYLRTVCHNAYKVVEKQRRKADFDLGQNLNSNYFQDLDQGASALKVMVWRSDVGSASCILCHSVKQEIMSALAGLIRLSWGQRLRPSVKVGQHGISALPLHSVNSAAACTWGSFRHRLWQWILFDEFKTSHWSLEMFDSYIFNNTITAILTLRTVTHIQQNGLFSNAAVFRDQLSVSGLCKLHIIVERNINKTTHT